MRTNDKRVRERAIDEREPLGEIVHHAIKQKADILHPARMAIASASQEIAIDQLRGVQNPAPLRARVQPMAEPDDRVIRYLAGTTLNSGRLRDPWPSPERTAIQVQEKSNVSRLCAG